MSACSLADLLQRRSRAAFCASKLPSFLHTAHVVSRCRSPNPCLPQQQDTIPYAVKNLSLTLLKMGKSLPETCWADLGDQKTVIVASRWFSLLLYLHWWCTVKHKSSLPELESYLRASCVVVTLVLSNLVIGGQTSRRTTNITLAKHSITAGVATVSDLSHMPVAMGACVCVYAYMYISVH
jgi:hypothetical protein